MTLLGKLYSECEKGDKPAYIPISYEGSDDKDIEQFQTLITSIITRM